MANTLGISVAGNILLVESNRLRANVYEIFVFLPLVMKQINFQPIDLTVFGLLRSYTSVSAMRNCDYAIPNLFCWKFLYETEYAESSGYLLLRFRFGPKRKWAYMAPVGHGDLAAVISLLAADAAMQGEDLCLCGVSDVMKVELERLYPDSGFHFAVNRDLCDYIYDRVLLSSLSGKALQPKRNHINKFLRLYPGYEYAPLSADFFPACLLLMRKWMGNQPATDSAADEYRAVQYAFAHYAELELFGGILLVEGNVVAFTYGSPVNADTFVVHVEKADVDYEGAYTMINKCFVDSLPDRYVFVNREEDMGIEGLRRAKLSYHPTILLNKWMAVRKIEKGDDDLKSALRSLWTEVFHDDDAFLDRFFLTCYNRNRVLFTLREGIPVSALYLLPLRDLAHPALKLAYVYAVATHPAHRGQGLMKLLLERMTLHLRAEGYDAAVLWPAEPWLCGFYRRFGFREAPRCAMSHDEAFYFLHDDGSVAPDLPFMVLPLVNRVDVGAEARLVLG